MFGLFISFVIALVVGFRRGRLSGPAVVGIVAISLFLAIVGVVEVAAFKPWMGQPTIVHFALAFLVYFAPLFAGFALGAAAKKQRLKNDAEADGSA